MAYLELDRDNPQRVCVRPARNVRPWFILDPHNAQILIRGDGRSETLDIDDIRRQALALLEKRDVAVDKGSEGAA